MEIKGAKYGACNYADLRNKTIFSGILKMKTFITIFPICENVHLTKDLGQIPYFMHKVYGYDSKIVCYKNSESYDNLEGEAKGLKIDFIKNTGRISFLEKEVLKYIYKNAKKID